MEPRIFPFWEPNPSQELDAGLRHAVEAVREQPVPGSALEQALQRAGRIPEQSPVRRPWFRQRLLVAAGTVAASLLLALGLWAVLSSIPVDGPARPGTRPGFAIGITKGTTDEERDLGNVKSLDDPGLDVYIDAATMPPQGRPGATQGHGAGRYGQQGVTEDASNTETSGRFIDNAFQDVTRSPLSTFPTRVDTASYGHVRRFLLEEKTLPPPDAVRVAELMNAFPNTVEGPRDASPVACTLNLVECPWNSQHHLLHIALKSKEADPTRETLQVAVAWDVRAEIEFNPQRIRAYRLIGFENRRLKTEDGNEDGRQGDSLGAGRTITALYEMIPAGLSRPTGNADPRKSRKQGQTEAGNRGEWLTVRFRCKDTADSKILVQPLSGGVVKWLDAPEDVRFTAAVAAFGMLLRKTEHCEINFAGVRQLAEKAVGPDVGGQRAEFLKLIDAAETLTQRQAGKTDTNKP